MDYVFQFRVMLFRLTNAPAVFQRLMHKVTNRWESVYLCYIDDLLIYSTTLNEHLKHLELVIQKTEEADLK